MKKIYSLKNKQEFNDIIKKGFKINSKNFITFYKNSESFKLGISIPKKSGNAIFRNKNKRWIKNILNNDNLYKDIKKNVVIISKREIKNSKYSIIEKEILNILEKLKNNGK